MFDQCPSLFEALAQVDNNTFPFQQHLKVACDLQPPLAHVCFVLFEQLIGQQMVHLKNSISERWHHHTFSNMLFDKIFTAHRV